MQDKSLFALSGVYHIKERLLTRLLRRHGLGRLSPAQGRILMALYEQDDIPVRKLSEMTSLDKSTLSLSLTRMEQFGLVERSGDEKDRRVVRVKLTRNGRSHRQACHEAMQELTDILYCGVTNEERGVFLRVLNQLFENVSEQERSAID
mgnify:CR=1 FL=1